MAFTAIGIGLAVASTATAGYEAKRGHDQTVQAKHQASDERARQLALQQGLDEKKKANETMAQQQIDLRRKRALAMGSSGDRYGTVKTSPLGVPKAPTVGGNTILGAA